MPRIDRELFPDPWLVLATYRERYRIGHLLEQVDSLERSIQRRQARRAAVRRRLTDLERQLEKVRAESRALEMEIEGSRSTGALLIDDILDRVRRDNGEVWSPTPVRGFRVWSIQSNAIFGNQTQWHGPSLAGHCLRGVPGEDIPHSMERCGPPPCGIYAVKSLDSFMPSVAAFQINHTVVGVVAMAGKVVEHEFGYRAQRATAIAVVAYDGGRRVAVTAPDEVEDLFRDPDETITRLTHYTDPSPRQARAILESVQQGEGKWT